MSAHPGDQIVQGLLSRAQSMSLHGPERCGRTWMCLDLAVAVTSGGWWLDRFQCSRGRVLFIDSRQHFESISFRLRCVVEARGLEWDAVKQDIDFILLHDKMRSPAMLMNLLEPCENELTGSKYDLITINGARTDFLSCDVLDKLKANLRAAYVISYVTDAREETPNLRDDLRVYFKYAVGYGFILYIKQVKPSGLARSSHIIRGGDRGERGRDKFMAGSRIANGFMKYIGVEFK